MVISPCIHATSFWPGARLVNDTPIRNRGFDYNFNNPNKLPPLTPMVANYVTPWFKAGPSARGSETKNIQAA